MKGHKVSSNKKNSRGEAKLLLSVERGALLVLLTISDLHGATRTLRVVTECDDELIPIRYPATTVEATAVPFAPDQLLERLRLVEAKIKEQREHRVQQAAALQREFETVSSLFQADGVKYMKKRVGCQVNEKFFNPKKGTVTIKSSGCSKLNCNEANCTPAPTTITWNVKTASYTSDSPQVNADLAPTMNSQQGNSRRYIDLCKRVGTIVEEVKAIKQKLPTAKPAEKKRLSKELEKKEDEHATLKALMFRSAGFGGWMGAPTSQHRPMLWKASQKDPSRYEALSWRARAILAEYTAIQEKLAYAATQTRKKQLSKLLACKETEFDEVVNDIAAIADGSEQDDSEDEFEIRMNNVPIGVNKTMILVLALAFVLALSIIAYRQLS